MTTKIEKAYIKASIPNKKVSDKLLDMIDDFDAGGGGGGSVTSVNGEVGVVVLDTDDIAEGSTNKYYTEARVNANVDPKVSAAQAFSIQRANHTGTQLASTISDFTTASRIASVADTIVNGTTDIAPSQNAVFDALALKIDSTEKGAALGVATLDAGGKVPVAQLPNSVMEYKGNYDASTNTPTLADGTGNTGDVYRVNVAGAGVNSLNFIVGDFAIYNGSTWEKAHAGADSVLSVNGFAGIVVLTTNDVAENVNLYFTDGRAQTATISQVITNGVTTKAPSEDAVFDALALKVTGPSSATDNAITRYDSTTGKLVQDSLATVGDTGIVSANDYTYTDVNFNTISSKQLLSNLDSTGVESGLTISIGTPNTTFSIASGVVNFVINQGSNSVKIVSYAGVSNLALSAFAGIATYIGIDTTSAIIQQNTPFTNTQRRTIVQIGVAIHEIGSNVITAVNQIQASSTSSASQLHDLENGLGAFNVNGNLFTPHASLISINKSVGTIHKIGSNWDVDTLNPNEKLLASLTAATFQYRFFDSKVYSPGGISDTTLVNPLIYDDLNGDTTPGVVAGGQFTVQRIVVFSSNIVRIQLGQTLYASMAAAIDGIGIDPYIIEQNMADNGILRGFLVIKGDTNTYARFIDTTRTRFIEAPKFGGTTGVTGISTTTLQGAYNNSTTPEIITNTILGALSVQRGSAADTDNVIEVKNGATTTTASITGAGVITGSNLSGTNTGDQIALTVPNTPAGTIVSTNVQDAINELSKHVTVFNATSSWSGPTSNEYLLTIASGTHSKLNPRIEVYETVTTDLEKVYPGIKIDSSNNIIISVTSSPDLRFAGKLIIS